ncbi:hyaluronidase A-like [Planococcus citri]|uniref:hyaluronidase A-like n=1 Tax=Planococcus citri TaxID=170843 RepID=UPI0031F9B643
MLDFQFQRLVQIITIFACLTTVPAAEQNFSPFYGWIQSWFQPQAAAPQSKSAPINIGTNGIKRNPSFQKNFKIVWNVPTFQCHKYGLNFSQVSDWGITQNYGDTFRGDRIALLYDPGWFPALLETTAQSDPVKRNGGVPQEGDVEKHLELFAEQIKNKLIPDENFAGIAIIDFEHWRPVWSENFGSLLQYRQISRQNEQHKHPLWSGGEIEREASRRFEKAAWQFMRRTLKMARKMRPKALWGYYGFPLCFNFTPKNNRAKCSDSVMENNERIKWLFEESSAIYPSLYYKKYSMTQHTRAQFMEGRVTESMRVARMSSTPTPVYPYTWFKYYDSKEFVDKNDLINSMVIPKKDGAAGVIIWGSSNDVNTESKCRSLHNYVNTVLGPAAKQILHLPKEQVSSILTNIIVEKPVTIDPSDNNNVDYVF